jgi:hypothetical protein
VILETIIQFNRLGLDSVNKLTFAWFGAEVRVGEDDGGGKKIIFMCIEHRLPWRWSVTKWKNGMMIFLAGNWSPGIPSHGPHLEQDRAVIQCQAYDQQ